MSPEQALAWLKYDARLPFFVNAIQLLNWERVEGDILEFGVGAGKSLALLAQLQRENLELWRYPDECCTTRRLVGFDSFAGLPAGAEEHPRWTEGSFARNYLYGHPSMAHDQPVTPDAIRALFQACDLAEPDLVVGPFGETIPRNVPGTYRQAALVHVDCDVHASAREVLFGLEPILQDGTLVCFDDWFMYRGNPDKGEARAFREFLEAHPRWRAIPYQTYSVFCRSFILHRRPADGPASVAGWDEP
jgi:hypothetical protein